MASLPSPRQRTPHNGSVPSASSTEKMTRGLGSSPTAHLTEFPSSAPLENGSLPSQGLQDAKEPPISTGAQKVNSALTEPPRYREMHCIRSISCRAQQGLVSYETLLFLAIISHAILAEISLIVCIRR